MFRFHLRNHYVQSAYTHSTLYRQLLANGKKQQGWHTMNTEKETSQSQTLTKDTLAYVKQGFIVEVI